MIDLTSVTYIQIFWMSVVATLGYLTTTLLMTFLLSLTGGLATPPEEDE